MSVLSRLLTVSSISMACLWAAPADPLSGIGLHFEPNRGQFGPEVRYGARTSDYSVALTGRSAVLNFAPRDGEPARRIDIEMAGASAGAEILPGDRLTARSDYFRGKNRAGWVSGVPHYGTVRYREAWRGIDVVYYGQGSRLEYDFVLQPGADAAAIRMRFHAAGKLSLTEAGDLMVRSGSATVVQKKPVLYQHTASGRREIRGDYFLIDAETAGVRVGDYDPSRALTIDPVVYATFLGTGKVAQIVSVKADSGGRLWVAGNIQTGDITATSGSYNSTFNGPTDVFVARINPAATGPDSLLYFKYIGGTGDDFVSDMVLDRSGNICLIGTTASTDFPTTAAAFQKSLGGDAGNDAFVVKLSPLPQGTDSLLYSTYLGGSGAEVGYGIAVDAAGMLYVTGSTQSTDFRVTSSAYASQLWGTQDAFVAKIDTVQGFLIWSSYLGGESVDDGRSIAVSPTGIAYVTGSTSSSTFPIEGPAYRAELQGNMDCWVARMDLTQTGTPSLSYSTYLGGSDLDEPRKIAVDSTGQVWVTGYTMSPDFPITGNAYQNRLAGNADVFLTRLNFSTLSQVVQYSTYLGGQGGDVGYDLTTDTSGNVYVTGYTLSSDFPVTRNTAVQPDYGFGVDSFVAKLNPTTGLVYSTYLGKDGLHVANALALMADGTICVAGYTGNGNMQVTNSAFQNVYSGGVSDGFLVTIK